MFDSPLELAWNRSVSFFSMNDACSPAFICKFIHMNGNQKYDPFPKHNRKAFPKMDILTV